MSFCTQCGNPIQENTKFCSCCGASVSGEPVQAPQQEAPAPSYAPVVSAKPVLSTKQKVFGFVGMGLAIFGLVMAAIGILYTILGLSLTGLGFMFAMIFGAFAIAPCIIGRIMCTNSIHNGNTSSCCTAGLITGLVGIIISGVMLFLGFINLLV